MKAILRAAARSLVEACTGAHPHDPAAACDATLQILKKHRLTARDERDFLTCVRKELALHEPLAASIITPSGTLSDHKHAFERALTKTLGRDISLRQDSNPDLLGGALLRFGDDRYDLSIRGALQDLQQQLTSV